ncbi:MAG: hypothetical protein PF484_01000 [Bacteroidales bacterium]|jgi:hypothetical protein|nr:hypothetical protein [Bacteroidales bacterium]
MKTLRFLSIFFLSIFLMGEAVYAQNSNNEIEVGYLRTGRVDADGFHLSQDATIQIEGTAGLYSRIGHDLMFYGWIIDGKTREVVWSLLEEEYDRFFRYRDSGKFNFEKEIDLPAGDYEVYYVAGVDDDFDNIDFDLGDLINLIVNGDSRDDYRNERKYSNFSMVLSGPENYFEITDVNKSIDAFAKDAIVSIVRAGNNEFFQKSFSVKSEVEVSIRGIGEQLDREQLDFAWIVNAKTFDKVWPNEDTRYRNAGGGRKNRIVSEKIDLEEGEYTIYFISDGSHSYDKWNVLPPDDPQSWGITLSVAKNQRNKVRAIENPNHFVLELNSARDNDYLSQAFTVKRDIKVRIYCLGERSGNYDMADYGWIINVDTREKVWEFEERNSEYAGGGTKNRMINEEIELEEGNYIAYYQTDGSHSYRDWNAAPPLIPELWGLSILAIDDSQYFELTDGHKISDENVLAEIIRVRDHEYEKRNFTLKNDSKVRIYAIGEGGRSGMDDIGWIRNQETGKIVWEMTYRNTDSAGGASKNRSFDGAILLPAGEYTVYYETDGSHSYRDWNSSPPHDQEHYGISVFLIN